MIQAILYSLGGGLCGALLVLACQWWQARDRLHDMPIYVWPVPGQSRQEQHADCEAMAVYADQVRQEDSTTRFVAQWDSGLGIEFPTVGRN